MALTSGSFKPSADNHEDPAGALVVPGYPIFEDPTDLGILIQRLVDRDAKAYQDNSSLDGYMTSALSDIAALEAIVGGGVNVMLTPEGGLAVKMINRTGGASVKGNVVCPFVNYVVTPGETSLSNMVAVVGDSASNTHGGRLYLTVTIPDGYATVSAYKDSARTQKVAEGALSDNTGGTVSMTQENASGLSFDIDIEADAVEDLTSAYVTRGLATGVAKADAEAINQLGVIYDSDVADKDEMWVVVAGKCYVSINANTAIASGNALITHGTTSGHVDAIWTSDATKGQRLVGWALERAVTAGSAGVVFCQLDLRGTYGVASDSGESRYDWEDSVDYLVPAGGGVVNVDFAEELPIPTAKGVYMVEVDLVLDTTDDVVSNPQMGLAISPIRFALFRNKNGVLTDRAGNTDFASYYPGTASMGAVSSYSSSVHVGSVDVLIHIASDKAYLRTNANYGTAGENYRWTGKARIMGA